MDTIICGASQPDIQLPAVTTPRLSTDETGAAPPKIPDDIASCPLADAPPLAAASDDSWTRLGVKPKAAASSTPSNPEHWTRVGASRGKSNPLSPTASHFSIHLNNKYEILSVEEFPPLGAGSRSSPLLIPKRSSGSKTRCSLPMFTPAPRKHWVRRSGRFSPSTRPPRQARQESRPLPMPLRRSDAPTQTHLPSLLVVGTSLVRQVAIHGGRTYCHPGASINDISSVAKLLSDWHRSASTLVIEAGVNDIKNQRSEELKEDYTRLVDSLLDTGKQLVISGPLPSLYSGDVKFSRLRQSHIWLKRYCRDKGIPFVDNFVAFLHRPQLFKRDSLHPNAQGSCLLASNIELTLRSCTA